MSATARTDVTVGEIRGRTVALCGVATGGNFSPQVAACGNSTTDPPTSHGRVTLR